MHLKCNNCQYVGDAEPRERVHDSIYLPCPRCGVVKIIAAGELHCDFCYGRPVHVVYLLNPFLAPAPFQNALVRARKQAACISCGEDIEHVRADPSDELGIQRILNRALQSEVFGPPLRAMPDCDRADARLRVKEMLHPLFRVMIAAITDGPELLN